MAGTGGIGGGSCNLRFEIKDNQGNVVSTSTGRDTTFQGKVRVTFNFPNEPPKVVTLGPNEEVTYAFERATP